MCDILKYLHLYWLILPYLLLGQLDLVELLHVLLIVLLLELPDEAQLLLWVVGVLLSGILLELHCCLRIERRHDLLSGTNHQRRVNVCVILPDTSLSERCNCPT